VPSVFVAACLLFTLPAATSEGAASRSVRQPAQSDEILELQVLLDRAHHSPGEIDGKPGSNTERATRAFQRQRGLDETGAPDEPTWAALGRGASPVLVEYVLTEEDVAGPFVDVPEDMMEKARLERLDHASALERVAERFHSSPELLRGLNPGASFGSAGETLVVPNVHAEPPAAAAARLVVSDATRSVTAFDEHGSVIAYYPASMGGEHDPLPIGRHEVRKVLWEPPFFYNPDLFWDADPAHAKAKVPPGPNNPVGVVWIDLSKEHYGIHGTPEPSQVGKTQSHGCIRLTNWDAAELARLVAEGTTAEFVGEGP
jgi:lipoprotein-anchoring transpeptidase ErfK/SrfK